MTTLAQNIQSNPKLSRTLLVLILSGVAGLLFYRDAITWVAGEVLNRSDSSHGVFVPVLTAYFLWIIKDRLRSNEVNHSWWGLPVMACCLLVSLVNIDSFQIQFIAFIGFACGTVLLLLGPAMFRTLAFPLLFLIAMTPLPQELYDHLANISRTIAFGGSLKIISWLGIPHVRVGWDIELPNALLRVAISCSGIRYLISFVVFGLAYAYLFRRSTTGRVLTVLATIPISLFASIGRLTIIFVMTYYVSPFWSQHRPHVILSWFVFFTVLFSCIFIDQWVQTRRERKGDRTRG